MAFIDFQIQKHTANTSSSKAGAPCLANLPHHHHRASVNTSWFHNLLIQVDNTAATQPSLGPLSRGSCYKQGKGNRTGIGSTRKMQSCPGHLCRVSNRSCYRPAPKRPHELLAKGTEPLHLPVPPYPEGMPSVLHTGCKTARNIQQTSSLKMTKIISSYSTQETRFLTSLFVFFSGATLGT